MDTSTTQSAAYPCPDPGHGEPRSRVGNRRARCKTCNAFARRLERGVATELRTVDPEGYEEARERVTRRLYADLLKGSSR